MTHLTNSSNVCNVLRHDSYMHAVPTPTTSRPSPRDANNTSHQQRLGRHPMMQHHIIITSIGYKYPTTYECMNIDTLCTCSLKVRKTTRRGGGGVELCFRKLLPYVLKKCSQVQSVGVSPRGQQFVLNLSYVS